MSVSHKKQEPEVNNNRTLLYYIHNFFTTQPARRFNKVEYNPQQVAPLSLFHYYRENLSK